MAETGFQGPDSCGSVSRVSAAQMSRSTFRLTDSTDAVFSCNGAIVNVYFAAFCSLKLTVSDPMDPLEREADRAGDQPSGDRSGR
jgi:hypothetical protein